MSSLKHPGPGEPSMWLAYVEVEDVAASTQKAKSLGAKIMRDVTEVPEAGTMSIIVDPNPNSPWSRLAWRSDRLLETWR